MPRTVTARFGSEEEAERALSAVAAEVPLRDSAVVSSGPAGSLMLDSLSLTPTERATCDQQLSKGGFLLVAQVASESRGEAVLRLLNGTHLQGETQAPALAAPAGAAPGDEAAPGRPDSTERESEPQAAAAAAPAASTAASDVPGGEAVEERIPMVEEELRVGKREVVRGRSRVRTFVAEIPVQEQVELLHEETHLRRRPVDRRISDEEVEQGGLLQERVIEITEMAEEAVVTKEAFVREELVVTKSLHRRVERVDETVRRTEVETERLPPE
ncbi:MAG: YsnF/AvaK domain-containing protein [Pseudomonadota bacterium]|nr:YsnF/AvaK domain-containing protein [Pseudomonadota bacterium]